MVVVLEPDEITEEELKEAHRKYPDNTPVKKALYEDYNYSHRQLSKIRKGEL